MHQSTGKNISLPQNIGSPSVYEPFYQTLCITLKYDCIREFQAMSFSYIIRYSPWLKASGSTRFKILSKYVYIVIFNGVNLLFTSIVNSGTSYKSKNSNYSLKQISELVSNAKQHVFRSLYISLSTIKNILFTIWCTYIY
jgi:hypothetical protein